MRSRAQRTSMLMSAASATMTRTRNCSIVGTYVRGPGGDVRSSPGSAIDSRIAVSACTFFMR